LLPALKAGHEQIITADDDHIYGKGWAKGLMKWKKRLPGSAVCYRGRLFGKSKSYHKSRVITRVHLRVPYLTGVSGVLYERGFFSDSIFEEWKLVPTADDVVINAHLKHAGVPIEVVPFPKGCRITRLPCMRIKPLYKINNKANDIGMEKVFW